MLWALHSRPLAPPALWASPVARANTFFPFRPQPEDSVTKSVPKSGGGGYPLQRQCVAHIDNSLSMSFW